MKSHWLHVYERSPVKSHFPSVGMINEIKIRPFDIFFSFCSIPYCRKSRGHSYGEREGPLNSTLVKGKIYKNESENEEGWANLAVGLTGEPAAHFIAVLARRCRCIGGRLLLVGRHLAALVLHVQQ